MKNEVFKFIQKGNLKDALAYGYKYLEEYKNFYYDLLMLRSRFEDQEKKRNQGIVSEEENTLEVNKITLGLIDLLEKVDDNLHTDGYITSSLISFTERLQHITSNRYDIIENIGDGASTIMFKAKDILNNGLVVIKALKVENLVKDSKAFENVERLMNIRHRNIVEVKSISPQGSSLRYVVLKYINGNDLEEIVLNNGRKTPSEIKFILSKVCDAVYHLHKRKIFHSDLRASRIIIDDEGEPVISPFSVFRTINSNSYDQIIADLKFMSYERLAAKRYKRLDAQANQFAVGALGYFMITGKPLFESDSLMDLMNERYRYQNDELYRQQKLSLLNEKSKLDAIILNLLSIGNKNRYSNMKLVFEEMEKVDLGLSEINQKAFDSYERACSYNPELTLEFLKSIEKSSLKKEFSSVSVSLDKMALRIHHIIYQIIESDENFNYLDKAIKSEELKVFFSSNLAEVVPLFLKLLKKSDYLWSKDIQKCWLSVFDKVGIILSKSTGPNTAPPSTRRNLRAKEPK